MNSILVRSELLQAVLGILTIAAVFMLFFVDILGSHKMLYLYPPWAADAFQAIGVFRLLSVIAIWWWSKFGVILYLCLAACSFVVGAEIGILRNGIVAIVCALVLLALVWPSWKRMPWGLLLTRASAGSPPSTDRDT